MANAVEERIVEARFDSTQFEKGVSRTLDKLNELQTALQFKDSSKTVADFAKSASDGIEKVGSTIDNLSKRLTTFTGMIKQQILSGLAQEVSNVILSVEQRITGFVKSLSGSQMMAFGNQKYTDTLDSVRTMTASGIDEDVAYAKIKRLGYYSDQTSYSLSQMTSGMSKLVAAGVDVDRAEKAMEGLANMCASAGVNVNEANRAFYNFAQAMSTGSMQIRDWMSFENLNMATKDVNKLFMEAAVQSGTLVKTIDKNGNEIFKTSNKINKKVKANKEVTAETLRNTLSYGWLDKETMTIATSTLAYFEDLGKDMSQLSDEELKNFAAKAYQAAKEARSFRDVMGTVKDAVATGWSTSFEIVFGKLEKATEFFTWLTESEMADVIYSIGDFRNAILQAWGSDYEDGGIFAKGLTGRDYLLQALKNIDEMIGIIREGLSSLGLVEYNEQIGRFLTTPEIIGKRMGELSKKFKDFTDRTKTGLKSVVDELTGIYSQEMIVDGVTTRVLKPEYAEKLEKIRTGISSMFGILVKVGKLIAGTIGKVFLKMLPVFDAVADAIGSVLQPITDLNNNSSVFNNITHAIDNMLIAIQPLIDIAQPIIRIIGKIIGVFIDANISAITSTVEIISEAIGFVIELFGGVSSQKSKEGIGVIERWQQRIEAFGQACKDGFRAVKDFFTALFTDIKNLLGIGGANVQVGGVFENISKFFQTNQFVQNVKAWLQKAVQDIGAWIQDIPSHFAQLVGKISKFIRGIFYMRDEDGNEIETPFKQWLDSTVKNMGELIAAWVQDLPRKIHQFAINIGNFIHGIFYTTDDSGNEVETPFKKMLSNVFNSIVNWLSEWVQDIPNKISSLAVSIGTFIHGFFYTTDEDGNEIETPFRKFFRSAAEKIGVWISDFVTNLPDKLWKFAVNIGKMISGLFYTTTADGRRIETPLKKWLSNAIKNIGKWLKSLPGKIWKGIQKIGDIAGKLWTSIENFIFGEKVVKTKTIDGVTVQYTERIKSKFAEWISGLASGIGEWIRSIPSKIGNIWQRVITAIFGEGSAVTTWWNDSLMPNVKNILAPVWDAFGKAFSWAGEGLSNVWTFFTEADANDESGRTGFQIWLATTVDNIKTWFEGAKQTITTWWTSTLEPLFRDVFGPLWKKAEELIITAYNWFTEGDTDTGETGFQKWIANIIEGVKTWFTNTSDQVVTWWEETLWPTLKSTFGPLWASVENAIITAYNWFTQGDAETGKTGFQRWIANIFESIASWFNNTTTAVSTWWEGTFKPLVAKVFGPLWEKIVSASTTVYDWFTKADENDADGRTGFQIWIANTVAKISEWFESAKGKILDWWDTISPGIKDTFKPVGEAIGKAFSGIWNFFTEQTVGTGKFDENGNEIMTTEFASWFEKTVDTVSTWWNDTFVPWAKDTLAPIGQFFSDIFSWILGLFKSDSGNEDSAAIDGAELMLAETEEIVNPLSAMAEGTSEVVEAADDVISEGKGLNKKQTFLDKIIETMSTFINRIGEGLKDVHFDESISTFLTGAAKLVSALFEGLGGFFEKLGKVIKGEKKVDSIVDDVSRIVDAVRQIIQPIFELWLSAKGWQLGAGALEGGLKKWLKVDFNSFGDELQKVGIGVLGLVASMAILDKYDFDEEKISKYGTYIAGLVTVVLTLMKALSGEDANGTDIRNIMDQIEGAANPLKDKIWTKVIEGLTSAVTVVGSIAVAAAFIPKIIDAIKDARIGLKEAGADQNGLGFDIMGIMLGIAGIMIAAAAAGTMFAKIQTGTGGLGLDPKATLHSVGSVLIVIGGMIAVLGVITGLDAAIQALGGDPKAIEKKMKDIAETLGSIAKSLGEGLGGFAAGLGKGIGEGVDAMTHGGLNVKERNALAQENMDKVTNTMKTLLNDMPIEQVENIVDVTERMTGIYERLADLKERLGDSNLIDYATNIAEVFRMVTQTIMEILSAFDTSFKSISGEFEDEKQTSTMLASIGEFFGFRHFRDEMNKNSQVLDSAEINQFNNLDFSAFESFAEGGKAYEAIHRVMDIITDLYGSLSETLFSENFRKTFGELRDEQLSTFFNRINTFFTTSVGENGAPAVATFRNMTQLVANAYQIMEEKMFASSDDLNGLSYYEKYFTDEARIQYQVIFDAIGELFDFMNGTMFSDNMFRLFTLSDDDLKNYFTRINNFFSNKITDVDVVSNIGTFWASIGRFYDQIDNIFFNGSMKDFTDRFSKQGSAKYENIFNNVLNAFDMFSMFSGSSGLGSDTWMKNYMAFSRKLHSSGFLEQYISDIELIYEALQKSTMFDQETGKMNNIYFDGVSILQGLFDAIQKGLDSEGLPEFDASGLGDAILKSIVTADEELLIAKKIHDMIQEGLLTFVVKPEMVDDFGTINYGMDTSQFTEGLTQVQGAINDVLGENGDKLLSIISDPNAAAQAQQMWNNVLTIKPETKKAFQDSILDMFKTTDAKGNETTFDQRVDSVIKDLQTMTSTASADGKSYGENLTLGIIEGIGLHHDEVVAKASALFDAIFSAIGATVNETGTMGIYNEGHTIGENLNKGIANGINTGYATAAAENLANAISGKFTVSWQIHSPSRLFAEFGKYLDAGLAQGIDANSDTPIEAAGSMAEESVENVRNILKGILDLAVDDLDISPVITPVVDMTNVNAAASAIRGMGFSGVPYPIDMTGMNMSAQYANPDYGREPTITVDYSEIISSIRGDIASLGARVSELSDSMNGMRVVLDTGAVVGGLINEIDAGLGRRGFYAGREG